MSKRSRQKRRERLDEMSPVRREIIAENTKERIYATITLLAVIAGLWQTAGDHSPTGAILTILGTATVLWAATLIAARMSYRAVHLKSMRPRDYGKLLFTSSGLFVPAFIPTVLILLSGTHLFTLKTALMAGMAALALSLFAFSFMAGRRIYESLAQILLISGLEMLLGIGVIALKLALGE